ncbi:50S ribosomal protein L4 [Saprolegnia diclina VS20]|uniref:Large ribosomal subunit protein uL4m n=1 Tax=Saprolegnia diclina (strain VS20) TaxID=1156394 RepID=T0Q0R2_SAPDV|nr:50S ribosomal protein L4 [Saprolegnia diclina VS20]EQC31419.1 50S ribosomal protein L4 [Saprolegnia diclina VS20]|eukprot:XP_008615260.1 50S ribosomal protein L4 [Saprolegnia diclina VS20]
MSLVRAFQALRVAAPARAFSAAASLPANLLLAQEKPKPEPRFVTREPLTFDAAGNVQAKLLSFTDGSEVGTLALNRSVFGAPIRKDILHRVVKWQLANRRSGNHKTKTRSEVSGSTRKAWAQKGSGRARVGNIRPPQWRGGYRAHGPVVRDHSYSLPKKVRAMGLRVALSTKLAEGKLAIVKELDVETGKTKSMKALLEAKGWDDALFVDGEEAPKNFVLATRNLARVDVLREHQVNVYSILHKDILVLSEKTVKYLEERLAVE